MKKILALFFCFIMNVLLNNKLILNGHRIHDINQFFLFFSKKFNSEIKSESDISNILKNYDNLSIAIWHSDTFLKEESEATHKRIIELLQNYGTVKQTGKIKKI